MGKKREWEEKEFECEIGFKGETSQGMSDICAFEVVEETDGIVLIIDFLCRSI